MHTSRWQGIFAILVTPLTPDGDLDEKGLRHLVDFACDQGFQGIVVLGSNGEFPYLSDEEKIRVMKIAAAQAKNRLAVLGGASDYATDRAVAYARAAHEAGCDGVMAALPAYFALDFAAAQTHFRTLAAQAGLPVFFYYFPEPTGLTLQADEIGAIAALENLPGAKITVVNKPFLKKVVAATRPHEWAVFVGTSFLFLDLLEMGGAGIFCPLPMLGPADIKAIHQAWLLGDPGQARRGQEKVLRALPIMSGLNLPAAVLVPGFKLMAGKRYKGPGARPKAGHHLIKEALRLQGHPISNRVRRPYREVTPAESELMRKTLAGLGWL